MARKPVTTRKNSIHTRQRADLELKPRCDKSHTKTQCVSYYITLVFDRTLGMITAASTQALI
jgi:hypothetical protein